MVIGTSTQSWLVSGWILPDFSWIDWVRQHVLSTYLITAPQIDPIQQTSIACQCQPAQVTVLEPVHGPYWEGDMHHHWLQTMVEESRADIGGRGEDGTTRIRCTEAFPSLAWNTRTQPGFHGRERRMLFQSGASFCSGIRRLRYPMVFLISSSKTVLRVVWLI